MERGEGVVIHDPDGNVFLDFVAGFGVLNTGHGHPRVVEAVKRQTEKLIHLMGAVNTTRTDLLDALTEITPGKGPKRVLFGVGGGEAVDMAIRLVRYYGKKYEIFAFYGAYHGRPYGALSLMGRGVGRRGLQPMLPGVVHVPLRLLLSMSVRVAIPRLRYRVRAFRRERCERPGDRRGGACGDDR